MDGRNDMTEVEELRRRIKELELQLMELRLRLNAQSRSTAAVSEVLQSIVKNF
jgi:ribosomal protein L29